MRLAVVCLVVSMMGPVMKPAYAETGVVRSVVTTAIYEKEPQSDLQQVSTDNTRVYYFTEIRGLSGHSVTHRWEYNGQVMAEITFQIEANRWRTWSSKNMIESWIGTWQVSVLDEGGNLLEQSRFEYVSAPDDEVVATEVSRAEKVEAASRESKLGDSGEAKSP